MILEDKCEGLNNKMNEISKTLNMINFIEPIVDYIENIYGYDNFMNLLTRLELLGEGGVCTALDIIDKDASIYFETPELEEKYGVYGFDLFCFNFSNFVVNLYVDYHYIDLLVKNNQSNNFKYNVFIYKVYIKDKIDLSSFKDIYYITDDSFVYDIDFKFREISIYNISKNLDNRNSLTPQQYLYLVNHNARYMNKLYIYPFKKDLNEAEDILNILVLNQSLGEKELNILIKPSLFCDAVYDNSSLFLKGLIGGSTKRVIKSKFRTYDEFIDYLYGLDIYRDNIYLLFQSVSKEFQEKIWRLTSKHNIKVL